jgi:hypothetical protein
MREFRPQRKSIVDGWRLAIGAIAVLFAASCSGPGRSATASPSPAAAGATATTVAAPASMTPDAPPTTRPASPPAAGRRVSAKKGVSVWYFPGATQALVDVGAGWYYTWAVDSGKVAKPAGVEFVPMIWGAASVTTANLEAVCRNGKVLLGFNEPDLAGQSNMSVAQALGLWPELEATGMRLGSPAPAYGAATPGSWFDQFMSGAAQRGYRVDFIALHWYGSDFSAAATDQLRHYLQAVYDRYHKPIWLTEYALINFSGSPKYPSQAQQAAFVKASTAMMQQLSFVQRYAWFALPATDGSGTGLYRDGHTPTTVGLAYRSAG